MPRPGLIRETYLTVNQQMDVAKRQITQILMVKWLLVGKKLSCFFNVLNFEDILFFCVKSHSWFIAKLPVPSVSSVDVEGFMSGSYTNRMHSTRLKQEVIKKYKENFVESLCTCLQRIHNIYTSFPTPSTASVCIHKSSCVRGKTDGFNIILHPLDPLGNEDWWLSSFWGNSYEQGLLGWGICPKTTEPLT